MESSFGEKVQNVHATLRQRFDKLSRVAVAIYDQQTDKLKTFAHSTEGGSPLLQYEVKLSEVPSLRYLAERQQPRVLDTLGSLQGAPAEHSRKLLAAGYESSYTEPLLFNSRLFGFLFCDAREPGYFDAAIRGELAAYAQILAAIIAVEFFSIQTLNGALTTAREFSRYRDEETANHLHRMSGYSRLIAREVAAHYPLNDEEVEFIHLFSELHDIGKIAVPDAILLKPGKLTPEEYAVMKIHPLKGREMIALMIKEFGLDGIHHTDMLKNIIAYHHERFDGQGYPGGAGGAGDPAGGSHRHGGGCVRRTHQRASLQAGLAVRDGLRVPQEPCRQPVRPRLRRGCAAQQGGVSRHPSAVSGSGHNLTSRSRSRC